MKLSGFLTLKAIVSLLFGVAFILIPSSLMSIFGVSLDSAGIFAWQLVGVSLTGIGLVCWLNKSIGRNLLSGIIMALFIADVIGFLVMILGQLAGQMNVLGWLLVAAYLAFATGLGYFYFLNPATT